MSDPNLALARERLGHVLKDRWTLEGVLGVGGMAAVYAARHRNGARAAIKLLHGPLSEDHVVRERFLREAYLANSLEHPGTVHVLDDDADPKLGPFLVMELLEGASLLELLDDGRKFKVEEILRIADRTLDVLGAAHERNIVHRDLKPANLFLCHNGALKVLDFGIARVLDASQSRLTRTGVPLGTPAYMAPEQARGMGRDADGRADLYALGATLFRLVAGRHVHLGKGAEQIAKVATMRAPKLKDVSPDVPVNLALVIDRSLEFEPERRYDDARAMQSDIRALMSGAAPPIASRRLPEAGPVPALPPLAPKKRGLPGPAENGPESKRDAVTELAESLRQRQREVARKPDAFKATVASGPPEMDDEDEEDMPTLVGSPRDMLLGQLPTLLAQARLAARSGPGVPQPRKTPSPERAPAASAPISQAAPQPVPISQPPPQPPPQQQSQTAAQAFARIPNVPVPSRHGSASPVPSSRAPVAQRSALNHDDDDLDAPTLMKNDGPPASTRAPMSTRGPGSYGIAPSRPIPMTQVAYGAPQIGASRHSSPSISDPAPPSIPPAPPGMRQPLDPPPAVDPVLAEDDRRGRMTLLATLAAIVILAILAGLIVAKLAS